VVHDSNSNYVTGIQAFCTLCLLLLAGCQGETDQQTAAPQKASKPAAKPAAKPLTLRTVSEDSLNLAEVLGDANPVETGKLEIAGPLDWGRAPRSSDYIARFYLDRTRRTRLPRIWITAETISEPAIETVTKENVIEYATQVASQLKSESDQELLEPVIPMLIGSRPCARYVRQTRFPFKDGNNQRSVVGESQVLMTMVAGRQFTVDLHVLPGDIKQFRDLAYAVLAGMNFLDAAEPEPAEEPATEDKPATDSP
jgi:hypothetical protein